MSPTPFFSYDPPRSAVAVFDDLIHQALQLGASDVHFETDALQFRVRFRIDGLLRLAALPPLSLRDALLTRIKVLARMDIAEKRLPQDGRIQHTHQDRSVDLRVSSMPTLHGEKLVLRLLNTQSQPAELSSLGYEPDELDRLHRALAHSDGMVLMTGPTGSGKTRSLYSCLNGLNRTELNICTLEDPIEIQIAGINQVQIHERVGLSFAHALRALLRQDPDVIMLGEIRDLDTADVALQAAQTGHLVLSTLHTPNAPSALARLQHMGLATHHVAASVRLVVAQRLLRRLCIHCRQPLSASQRAQLFGAEMQPARIESLSPPHQDTQFFSPIGCSQCQDGYSGRVGVFQVMPVSEAMQSLLFKQADAHALAALAQQEQVRTLRQSAWLKAARGLTSVQEVWQHTPSI